MVQRWPGLTQVTTTDRERVKIVDVPLKQSWNKKNIYSVFKWTIDTRGGVKAGTDRTKKHPDHWRHRRKRNELKYKERKEKVGQRKRYDSRDEEERRGSSWEKHVHPTKPSDLALLNNSLFLKALSHSSMIISREIYVLGNTWQLQIHEMGWFALKTSESVARMSWLS